MNRKTQNLRYWLSKVAVSSHNTGTLNLFDARSLKRKFLNISQHQGINWRASEASEVSETLSAVYEFELVRYIYICMEVRMP